MDFFLSWLVGHWDRLPRKWSQHHACACGFLPAQNSVVLWFPDPALLCFLACCILSQATKCTWACKLAPAWYPRVNSVAWGLCQLCTQTLPRSQQQSGVKLQVLIALPWAARPPECRGSFGSGTWSHPNLQYGIRYSALWQGIGMRRSLQSLLTQTILWQMLQLCLQMMSSSWVPTQSWYPVTNFAALFQQEKFQVETCTYKGRESSVNLKSWEANQWIVTHGFTSESR